MASSGHREWAPQERTPELIAFEAGIRQNITFVQVFRNSLLPSGFLSNNDQTRFRGCSELTKLALRTYLQDHHRRLAALGNEDSQFLMRVMKFT